MKLLVTGAAGFIGSNFVNNYIDDPAIEQLLSVDCLTYAGNMANLDPVMKHPKHVFKQYDIRNPSQLRALFKKFKPTHILHMAAESHVDRSITYPESFINTNVIGTYNLLEAARLYPVEKFVHVSTDEVYGSVDSPATVDSPLNPSSPYSASKASADMLCIAYNKTYKVNTVVTRCVNNYGPNQYREKLIPKVIYCALSGTKIPVYGTGENIRDWIHVDDHCRRLMEILTNAINPQIIHIAGGNEIRNIDLIRNILDLCLASESLIEFVEDRKGHDERYSIQGILDPINVNFKLGLFRTVESYRLRLAKSAGTSAVQSSNP